MRQSVRAIVVREGRTLVMYRNKFGNEYYTLVGGGVDMGETLEEALARELREETGFVVRSARPVFVEDAGDIYGPQYMYLCEVEGDEPRLGEDTEEFKTKAFGNIYEPKWVDMASLDSLPFRSERLKRALLYCAEHGWPEKQAALDDQYVFNLYNGQGKEV